MPEIYPPFNDIKGKTVKVYTGIKKTRDRVITLKEKGTAIDISGFDPIHMLVIESSKPEADAIQKDVLCTLTGPTGQITIPFSSLTFAEPIEGVIFIFEEIKVAGNNETLGKFKGDILKSNTP